MIATVVRIGWINLKRDRVAQALTFLLPIAFFSIFASVFGGQGRAATSRVRVAVVDEDGSELSRRLVAALEREGSLRVRKAAAPRGATRGTPELPLDRARAEELVRDGDVPVAVVIPKAFGEGFGRFDAAAPKLRLLSDPSDAIAPQVVAGLLQKAGMTAAPDVLVGRGIAQFRRYAGGLTPEQEQAVGAWLPSLDRSGGSGGAGAMGVGVEVVDVLGSGARDRGLVAFYAAGIGVMFLLFSCSAASGSLLEEIESGTLERLLGSRLGMGGLLVGKWLYLTLLGVAQLAVMFAWGALVFGLELRSHLAGFLVMTLATATAAAGFGLVLASAARTRAQLGGLSTIVILMMSALGGSMFPRFLMSETMQKIGLATFNAWALDGYVKVFWRNAPLVELWPQLLVLASLAAVFMLTARLLARRWESA